MVIKRATFSIKVTPNATKNEIIGFADDVLRVKVAAPPVKGKANKELVNFLCRLLKVNKDKVSILKGHTSRNKLIAIEDMSKESALELLLAGRDNPAPPRLF